MSVFRYVILASLLLASVALAAPAKKPAAGTRPAAGAKPKAPAAKAASRPGVNYIGSVPDTGQYLPDSTVLATVGPRRILISRFIDAYFASTAEFRPAQDSLGRVQFLNSLITKDILGQVALGVNRPLQFEDRTKLREYSQRALSNAVYQKMVVDSVKVTEDEIRDIWRQLGYEQRLRHILFADRGTADRVRRELLLGRLTWSQAVSRYNQSKNDPGADGEIGWLKRDALPPDLAIQIFGLKPGETSPVVQDREGFHIVQSIERRNVSPPSYEPLRNILRRQLVDFRSAERANAIQAQLRAEMKMVHDSSNAAWAAKFFRNTVDIKQAPLGTSFDIDASVPEFSAADTARTLARWPGGGRYSLGELVHTYTELQPMLRPSLNSPEAIMQYVDGIVLEPKMSELAVRLRLDKDPFTAGLIENRREELAVEHMFQDSVQSRTHASREERRAYYEKNKVGFITYPHIRFAAIIRPTKAAAESLAAQLQTGRAKAEAVLRADSLRGEVTGSIQSRRQDERGAYQRILFEELKPGRATVTGPDAEGTFLVLQLLEYTAGRQLSFEEAEGYIDESLQNIKGQALLDAMIERHRSRFPITARYDLLMRIRLTDNTMEQ